MEIEIITQTGKTARAHCGAQKSETIKVLQVSNYQSGQIKILASADNNHFELVKFDNDSDMIITSNIQIELPAGNYVIKADFDGAQESAPTIMLV